MTLPGSGALSMSAIDTEIGVSSVGQISMDDASVRTLLGIGSGQISMSSAYGKSYGAVYNTAWAPGLTYWPTTPTNVSRTMTTGLYLNAAGTTTSYLGAYSLSNWYSSGNAASASVRCYIASGAAVNASNCDSAWRSLISNLLFAVSRTGTSGGVTGTLTFDFSNNSGGSIVFSHSIPYSVGFTYYRVTTCPAPWVLITVMRNSIMADVPAGTLKIGDLIWTRPEGSVKYGPYAISALRPAMNEGMRLVMKDGRILDCSVDHPFSVGKRWVEMQNLKPGMLINGTIPGRVKTIAPLGMIDVVQITIESAHTFLSDGLLSHNKVLK